METTNTTASCAAIECSDKISNICAAMAKAQAKIRNAERDAENPYFNSSYASLAGVWDVVRGPLTENELAIFQGHKVKIKPDMTGGEVDVTTMLTHSTGEWFRTTVTLPVVPMGRKKRGADDGDNDADRTPGKVTPQAIGSAITYWSPLRPRIPGRYRARVRGRRRQRRQREGAGGTPTGGGRLRGRD